MLELAQIESFFPQTMRPFKKNMMREYLQYKILEAIFESDLANKLIFMGGTAIRIAFGSGRFSEDLDFDNLGLTEIEFKQVSSVVERQLSLEGYEIEKKLVFKNAFHCHFGILNVLFDSGISRPKEEKLVIRLDTHAQGFSFKPAWHILNKFDVFTRISLTPDSILLAQKLLAILNRKRAMGRDIYDAIFLLGKTSPDLDYLNLKLGVKDMSEVRRLLLLKCETLDFKALSNDVAPLVVRPEDARKILLFRDLVETL